METLGLAIFMCFVLGLLELRDLKAKSAHKALKALLELDRKHLETRLFVVEKALEKNDQSFLELKDLSFKANGTLDVLLKAHQSRMSGSYAPPQGDHYEEIN